MIVFSRNYFMNFRPDIEFPGPGDFRKVSENVFTIVKAR